LDDSAIASQGDVRFRTSRQNPSDFRASTADMDVSFRQQGQGKCNCRPRGNDRNFRAQSGVTNKIVQFQN